jgi:hypothetical protein
MRPGESQIKIKENNVPISEQKKKGVYKNILSGVQFIFLSIGYRRINRKNNYKSNRKSRNPKTS